jgi:hypothetical protein
VSGVRSSCDASAAKRRSRASDASLAANATSSWFNMALSADARRATSVLLKSVSMRAPSSPPPIALATPIMSSIGLMPTRLNSHTSDPMTRRAATAATSWIVASSWIVSCWSVIGAARTSTSPLPPNLETSTR